jgi:hypothetical protein
MAGNQDNTIGIVLEEQPQWKSIVAIILMLAAFIYGSYCLLNNIAFIISGTPPITGIVTKDHIVIDLTGSETTDRVWVAYAVDGVEYGQAMNVPQLKAYDGEGVELYYRRSRPEKAWQADRYWSNGIMGVGFSVFTLIARFVWRRRQ